MLAGWAGLANVAALPDSYYVAREKAAKELGIPEDWLHKLIKLESSFRLTVINKWGYAGIGQWSNSNARLLGFASGADLVRKCPTWETQMPVMVRWIKYLWKTYGYVRSPGYLYVCHFLPANANHYSDKSWILRGSKGRMAVKGNAVYDNNKVLDANGDGKITIGDIDKLFEYSDANLPLSPDGTFYDDLEELSSATGELSQVFALAVPVIVILGIFSFISSD